MGKSGANKKKSAPKSTPAPTAAPTATISTPNPSPPLQNGLPPDPSPDAAAQLRRAHELKEEGNCLFQSHDYSGALRQYELALRLAPRGHPDRAVFHSNRAACLLQLRPVDHEAVAAECSLALQAQPRFHRALLRRARALDALGHRDLALQDAVALLSLDPSHKEALDLAHRLKSQLSQPQPETAATSRPSPAALGASAVVAGLGPSLPSRPFPKKTPPASTHSTAPTPFKSITLPSLNPPPLPPPVSSKLPVNTKISLVPEGAKKSVSVSVPAKSVVGAVTKWRPLKLVYDHDIRLGQMPVGCSFRVLREVVAKRFPSSKAVLIKCKDGDGDLVTITSTEELRVAEECVDKVVKAVDAGKEVGEKFEVLRLHIVEVSLEQEPPLPEEEEKIAEDETGVLLDEESLSQSLVEMSDVENEKPSMEEKVAEESVVNGKKECGHPECKEAEIDDWLLQFAELFRNQVGIDPEAHLDLHELGMELCSEALEETVTSEEAQGLFEMAASKFQEVAALALFNWGNVHMCAARKRIPLDESAPKEVVSAQLCVAYDWVRERYALAGQKYEEALVIKPDFYEGLLALGQQHFETAKLHWSFALANKVDLSTWDSSETIMLFDNAEEKMKAATAMWEKVEEQRIAELKDPEMSKKDELLKKRRKQGATDGQEELTPEEAAEQTAVMKQQIHLFCGNMLFERSQFEFKLNVGDWKKNFDASIERFKLAGASESDISVVIKNHASNAAASECEEKNVMISSTDVSDSGDKVDDKCVVES